MLKVYYFPHGTAGPVGRYLELLAKDRPKAFARLAVDLGILGEEGLRSSRIMVRPMGAGLWELKRHFDGVHYRVFFCVSNGAVWLLHSIEKRKAKTPKADLDLARKRQREVER